MIDNQSESGVKIFITVVHLSLRNRLYVNTDTCSVMNIESLNSPSHKFHQYQQSK